MSDRAELLFAGTEKADEYRKEIDALLATIDGPKLDFVSDESTLGDFAPIDDADRADWLTAGMAALEARYGQRIEIDCATPLWKLGARLRVVQADAT